MLIDVREYYTHKCIDLISNCNELVVTFHNINF
jgi:hypothetical protein